MHVLYEWENRHSDALQVGPPVWQGETQVFRIQNTSCLPSPSSCLLCSSEILSVTPLPICLLLGGAGLLASWPSSQRLRKSLHCGEHTPVVACLSQGRICYCSGTNHSSTSSSVRLIKSVNSTQIMMASVSSYLKSTTKQSKTKQNPTKPRTPDGHLLSNISSQNYSLTPQGKRLSLKTYLISNISQ